MVYPAADEEPDGEQARDHLHVLLPDPPVHARLGPRQGRLSDSADSGALPPLGDVSLRRLLVATDGSRSSELALEIAVRAAKLDNAALTLLTVEPDVNAEAFRWSAASGTTPEQLQREVEGEADRSLREAIARIPDEIPITTVHRRGRAGPEIVAAAEEGDFDAILIGARGVGRVGSVLLGSVSQYVLHHATTHVIVARDGRD